MDLITDINFNKTEEGRPLMAVTINDSSVSNLRTHDYWGDDVEYSKIVEMMNDFSDCLFSNGAWVKKNNDSDWWSYIEADIDDDDAFRMYFANIDEFLFLSNEKFYSGVIVIDCVGVVWMNTASYDKLLKQTKKLFQNKFPGYW